MISADEYRETSAMANALAVVIKETDWSAALAYNHAAEESGNAASLSPLDHSTLHILVIAAKELRKQRRLHPELKP